MIDNKNDYIVPCKKFKSSADIGNENSSQDFSEDDILSSSRAETEAGSYFLGPAMKKCVRSPVTVRLGRKKGTDEYYLMKLLVLDDYNKSDRGLYIRRTVFHNEYAILSLLKNHNGIIQLHDFFKDYIYREVEGKRQKLKRVGMAMECLFPHGPFNSDMMPLSHYLKGEKLSETEALHILYNLLCVISKMHKSNVVHREIKLSNIILNRKTFKIKLMDFYYAKMASACGTSNYDKPVVSSCLPKTNDVWAAGVVFYAMLCSGCPGTSKFGSLLSSVRSTQDLYVKLEENKCALLKNASISGGAKEILCCILCSLPQYRLKAYEATDMVSTLLAIRCSSQNPNLLIDKQASDQIVPECSDCRAEQELELIKSSRVEDVEEKAGKTRGDSNHEEDDGKDEIIDASIDDMTNRPPQLCGTGTLKSSEDSLPFIKGNIKYAMMRLGATSLNSINALSFCYNNNNNKRHSCLSQ